LEGVSTEKKSHRSGGSALIQEGRERTEGGAQERVLGVWISVPITAPRSQTIRKVRKKGGWPVEVWKGLGGEKKNRDRLNIAKSSRKRGTGINVYIGRK